MPSAGLDSVLKSGRPARLDPWLADGEENSRVQDTAEITVRGHCVSVPEGINESARAERREAGSENIYSGVPWHLPVKPAARQIEKLRRRLTHRGSAGIFTHALLSSFHLKNARRTLVASDVLIFHVDSLFTEFILNKSAINAPLFYTLFCKKGVDEKEKRFPIIF